MVLIALTKDGIYHILTIRYFSHVINEITFFFKSILLNNLFKQAPIFCWKVTGKLVLSHLKCTEAFALETRPQILFLQWSIFIQIQHQIQLRLTTAVSKIFNPSEESFARERAHIYKSDVATWHTWCSQSGGLISSIGGAEDKILRSLRLTGIFQCILMWLRQENGHSFTETGRKGNQRLSRALGKQMEQHLKTRVDFLCFYI